MMPMPAYLNAVNASMAEPLSSQPPPAPPLMSVPPPTPQFPSGSVTGTEDLVTKDFLASQPPAPLPAASPPGAVPTEPLGPMGPPPPAPSPQAQYMLAVQGGINPAHEVDRRGPTFIRAQNQANAATQQAIAQTEERSQQAAMAEYQMARVQAAKAYAREDAAMQSEAERTSELAARQKDFDSTVSQLSQMRMDPDRFWASRSTAQKVSGLIGIALGGFLQGARGGSNPGLDIINQAIDRDIDAQKFAYAATHDTASAKQTAFAIAMQKYQNEDAARAMARAAALDAVIAETAQVGALHKGTEVGNRADAAIAQLQIDKMNQIGQGVAFIPATQRARVYVDPRTGLRYTEHEMKALVAKEGERDFSREQEATKIGGQLMVEGAKAQGEADKHRQQLQVRLPNGDVIVANSADQHKQVSEAAASVQETRRLVAEAKRIREGWKFRMPTTEDHAKLQSIQSNLVTQYGVQNKLGALSESDMSLAVNGVGDLFAVGSGPEAVLDRTNATAEKKLSSLVSTIPGAPARDRGEMPGSFVAHGKK